ncbi:hypothetical protein AAG906_022540 [Vitis piasezkii]
MQMLRDRLVKIITDYRTETSLRHGCNDILKADCVNWTCTEMVMPIGHGNNDTMFQAWPFDLNNHTKTCQDLFGVTPIPHWITTEFGGHVSFDFFLFYSSTRYIRWRGSYMYGVYRQRCHCLDLSTPTATDSQQEKEVKIIGLCEIQDSKARELLVSSLSLSLLRPPQRMYACITGVLIGLGCLSLVGLIKLSRHRRKIGNFVGFMVDLASRFKGLLLIQYYGESVPLGSKDIAFNNTNTLKYFSSTQALADYAELITNLKKNLSAEYCHRWKPLNSFQQLKVSLEYTYQGSARHDNPPSHYVSDICNAINGAPEGTSILGRVAEGVSQCWTPCHRIYDFQPSNMDEWVWQTCTEMVMPFGRGDNDTTFQTCQNLFGVSVTPRPHWITTEFCGHDIKSVLGNFACNIIFSNGLRDPVQHKRGSTRYIRECCSCAHCLDLRASMPNDPDWLVAQRDKEIKIVALWLAKYNGKRLSN